jgi:hypothetical protein
LRLSEWIKVGAAWPVRDTPLPKVKDSFWIQSPIDRVVLACLEAEGMKPVQAGSMARRVRQSRRPIACFTILRRALWGRHWLDVMWYGEADVRGSVPLGHET